MKTRTLQILILMLIAGCIGYYVGVTKINLDWGSYQPKVAVSSKEPPPSITNIDMTMFWNVLDKLNSSYYDKSKMDSQKMVDGAIEGMVATLNDPYTVYLPPKANTDFKQGLSGQFQGIGAELGIKDKDIIVVAPLDGSPAEKAGIKAGDALIKVDDQPTLGWTLDQTVNKIRGPKGTKVMLSIVHKGDTTAKDISITRDTITVKSVASWTKSVKDISSINKTDTIKNAANDQIAYIRLSQFGDNTNQEWLDAVNKIALAMQKGQNFKGVILDLRNNPGGYLTDAVFIASEFLNEGDVVVREQGDTNDVLNANRKGLLINVPLIILINKGSASASEILSGALHDNGKAKLVGESSFGKGIVQSAEDLGGGAGLHITTSKWLTPNSTWVGDGKNGTGLKPDISVSLDPKDPSHDTQLEKAIETLVQ